MSGGLTWRTGAVKLARRKRRRHIAFLVLTLGLGRAEEARPGEPAEDNQGRHSS